MIRKLAKVAVGVPIDAHRRIVTPRLFDRDKQAASQVGTLLRVAPLG